MNLLENAKLPKTILILSDFMTIEHDDVEDRAEKDASSPSRSRYFPRAIAKSSEELFAFFEK